MDAKTYNQKSKEHDGLLTQRHNELQSVIGGNVNEFGGANDEIRRTKEYLNAKNRYDMIFRFIQDFNKSVPKKIKQEVAKLRRDEKLKGLS